MTLTMGLRYKNPDASADINLRLKDVANKGFVAGGRVTPVVGALQVTVEPFVCITYDGAVVRSDANIVLSPGDGTSPPTSVGVTVVALRARYVPLGSPIMVVQAMPVESYLTDPEINWLTVLAIVDLTSGAPHSEVPADAILTTWTNGINTVERHAVDPQNRSSFRAPVVNSGDLLTPGSPYLPPLADNRNGDVVFATDTGTFYWWNGASWSWEIFDEVPLAMHREHEHTNGITGDSNPETLTPSASLTTITIGFVPPGSGYTVNGRYRTSPTVPVTRNLAVGGLFPSRGLIQASVDEDGVADVVSGGVGDYRVRKNSGDPVDIAAVRILDISDRHTNGTFPLSFDAATGLSWNLGEPVNVGVGTATGGRYRLFAPNYLDWIDVELTAGAVLPALASDSYDVMPSKKDDEHMLVAHFWWDGTTASVGADKRYFGNIGLQELSYDYKNTEAEPWVDLRGNSVYSGGDVSIVPSDPTKIRITGPIVVYLNRPQRPSSIRRIVPVTIGSENGYTGITPLAGGTGYVTIFVNTNGVLSKLSSPPAPPDSEGWPVIPDGAIRVCNVKVDGGTVVLIEDARDPQIIVGQATRTARLRWTAEDALEWTPATGTLKVAKNDSTSGTNVLVEKVTGGVSTVDMSTGVLRFSDENTPAVQAMTDWQTGDLTVMQPLNPYPSVFGALRDGQRGQRHSQGVQTGFSASSSGLAVSLSAGTMFDSYGRRIETTSSTSISITTPAANQWYVICWDPDSPGGIGNGAFVSKVMNGSFNGADIQDLPIALARVNSANTAISTVVDIRRYASGEYSREYVTIGSAVGFNGANFPSLRQAMLWAQSFKDDVTAGRPKIFFVLSDYTEPFSAASGGCIKVDSVADTLWEEAADRLEGIRVVGVNSTSGSSVPTISYGTGTDKGFFIDFNYALRNWTFENVIISFNGGVDPANSDNTVFKDAGSGFTLKKVSINGNSKLTHVCLWTAGTAFGGRTSGDSGLLFDQVQMYGIGNITGTPILNLNSAGTHSGNMSFRSCFFSGSSTNRFSNVLSSASGSGADDLFISFEDCAVEQCSSSWFNQLDDAEKHLTRCRLDASAVSYAIALNSSFPVQVTDCIFSNPLGIALDGCTYVTGCIAKDGCPVNGGSSLSLRLTNCDFRTDGTFSGNFQVIENSRIVVTSSASLLATNSGAANESCSISSSYIRKGGSGTDTNTMLVVTPNVALYVDNSTIYWHSGVTSIDPGILIEGTAPYVSIVNTRLIAGSNRPNMNQVVRITSSGSFTFITENCVYICDQDLFNLNRGGTVAGYVGSIVVKNCNLDIEGLVFNVQYASDLLYSFYFEGNTLTTQDSIFFSYSDIEGLPVNGMKKLLFKGNIITISSSSQENIKIGSDNSIESIADISNNHIYMSGGGAIELLIGSFFRASYTQNTIRVVQCSVNNGSTSIRHLGTSSEQVVIKGNSITHDATAVGARCIIDVGDGDLAAKQVAIANNQIYVDADGGDGIYCAISSYGGANTHNLSITGNSVLASNANSGEISYYTFANAVSGLGVITIANNTVEVDNGASATAEANLRMSSSSYAAASTSVTGNTLRLRSNSANTGQTLIEVNATSASITGNSITSSEQASIRIGASTINGIIMSNSVYSVESSSIFNDATNAIGNATNNLIIP